MFLKSLYQVILENALPQVYHIGTELFYDHQILVINLMKVSLSSLSSVCALIISTFYMRYRINTLEEQLGLLTSIVDTHNTE